MTTTVSIAGMTCAHCVRAVFTALGGVPGVQRADVSIGQAVIEHAGTVTPEAIHEAIADAGYDITLTPTSNRTLPLA